MVFAPTMHYSNAVVGERSSVWASLPYLISIELLTTYIPGWVVQKVILFGVLWVSGIGAHRLACSHGYAAYYAGLLYLMNPFVALRLLLGQWTLLVVYASLPFVVIAFQNLLKHPSLKHLMIVALLWTINGMFQLHGLVIVAIIGIVLTVSALLRAHNFSYCYSTMKLILALGAMMLLLNAYWLVSILPLIGRIDRIQESASKLFAVRSALGYAVEIEVAAMMGFWWTDIIPLATQSMWMLSFGAVLFLALLGFQFGERKGLWTTLDALLLLIIGLFLALGPASTLLVDVSNTLWSHVPLFKGFREAHKFVMLVVLGYAYLGSVGVGHLSALKARVKSEKQRPKILRMILILLTNIALLSALMVPLSYGWNMKSFNGQVESTDYPTEWYGAKAVIQEGIGQSNLLVLPWHSFLDISWLEQEQNRVANPARLFFEVPTIQADNLEMPGYYSDSADPSSLFVENMLSRINSVNQIGKELVPLNVKYIVLLKEEQYQPLQSALDRQIDLIKTLENKKIALYENMEKTGRVLSFQKQNSYEEEYDVLARGHKFKLGAPLAASKIAPGRVEYLPESADLVGLSVAQGDASGAWTLDGEKAIGYYKGIVPVFTASGEGIFLRTSGQAWIRAGYILTTLSVVIIGVGLTFQGFLISAERRRRFERVAGNTRAQ